MAADVDAFTRIALSLYMRYRAKALYEVAIKSVYERTILKLKEAARQSAIQSSRQSFSLKDELWKGLHLHARIYPR